MKTQIKFFVILLLVLSGCGKDVDFSRISSASSSKSTSTSAPQSTSKIEAECFFNVPVPSALESPGKWRVQITLHTSPEGVETRSAEVRRSLPDATQPPVRPIVNIDGVEKFVDGNYLFYRHTGETSEDPSFILKILTVLKSAKGYHSGAVKTSNLIYGPNYSSITTQCWLY